MRMETLHSKAHNIGWMGICHGDNPHVTCKRCGILCCYSEKAGVRCWQERFGDNKDIEKYSCDESFF